MPELPLTLKSEGQQIVGMLHLPDKTTAKTGKYPLIVMLHGFTGNKTGPGRLFVRTARKLIKSGYAVFRFDFRGSEDSEGNFETQNLDTEFTDLKNVLKKLVKIKEIDPSRIGLIGHSRGGFLAVTQASKDKRIKCLVCWAPAVFFKSLWGKRWVKEIMEKGYKADRWGNKFTKQLVLADFRYDNNIKDAKKLKTPIRIIHGNRDRAVPLFQSKTLYKNLACKKDLVILKGANHIFTGDDVFEKLVCYTEDWFKKFLIHRGSY